MLGEHERGILIDGRWEWKLCSYSGNLFGNFLEQLNVNLPSDPELPPLGSQLKEMVT